MEWKSYELRPEGVEIPEKSPEYYERAWVSVRSLAAENGLDMKHNMRSRHSRKAHEGLKFAEQQGKGAAYTQAVFQAQFEQEQDIDSLDTLAAIAEKVELDPQAFRQAVESRKYAVQVDADTDLAAQYGITGVPCFVVGNRGAFGVQSYEALEQLLSGQDPLLSVE